MKEILTALILLMVLVGLPLLLLFAFYDMTRNRK